MKWLLKDFILLKKRLGLFYLAAVVYIFFMGWALRDSGFESLALVISSLILVYYYLSAAFEKDEKDSGMLLYLSMPYKREEIVFFRYLFVFILWIIFCGLSIVIAYLSKPMLDITAVISPGAFLGSFFVTSFVSSLFIPVCYRFGYIKAKPILSISFVIALIVCLQAIDKNSDKAFKAFAAIMHRPVAPYAIILLAAMLAMVLSYKVSIRQFSEKDF